MNNNNNNSSRDGDGGGGGDGTNIRKKNRRALLSKGVARTDIFLAYGQEELFLNM